MEYNGGDLFYLNNGIRLRIENINNTPNKRDLEYFGTVITDIKNNEIKINELNKFKEKKYFIYGFHVVNDYLFELIINKISFDINSIWYISYGDSESKKDVWLGSNELFEYQTILDEEIKNDFIRYIKKPKLKYENIESNELIREYLIKYEGVKFLSNRY
jgi:hypothetical protein